MKKDNLGDRMKGYETVSTMKLIKRMPVIIRLDGKAFHTWTRQLKNIDAGLEKDPFSIRMNQSMSDTAWRLVKGIQNAVFAYTQSDEISILLNDWKTLTTDQWYGNGLQKMASVSASMATAYFNEQFYDDNIASALFDARVFNLPKEEVVNYFVWRQQDATRNSINMLGQFYFSHKELQGKNVSEVQDMLMMSEGYVDGRPLNVNWNDLDTWKKRGTCITRGADIRMAGSNGMTVIQPNETYKIDKEIPIFTQDRDYIERLLNADET